MRRFYSFCAVTLVFCTSLLRGQMPKVRPNDSTSLRIATWNVLNLFDNHDNPSKPDEGTDPKSRIDLVRLAEAIDALDVDVLGVQEVENRQILSFVNDHLKRPFAHVELLEGNDHRGIDVGILSRVPLERAVSHRQMVLDGEHRFARDFALFRLRPNKDTAIDIGIVHLKSRRGGEESDAWRRAEAAGINRVIKRRRRLEPDVPIVVMGDFNDSREKKTLAPVFAVLKDLSSSISEEDRYSYSFRGRKEQIDFVLGTEDIEVKRAQFVRSKDRISDHHALRVEIETGAKVTRLADPTAEKWKELRRQKVAATDLDALSKLLLHEVEVTGKVVKLHRTRSGAWAALNFKDDYRNAVTVRIYTASESKFPKLESLVGKTVTAIGPVCRDRGVYRMVISDASQLSVSK